MTARAKHAASAFALWLSLAALVAFVLAMSGGCASTRWDRDSGTLVVWETRR